MSSLPGWLADLERKVRLMSQPQRRKRQRQLGKTINRRGHDPMINVVEMAELLLISNPKLTAAEFWDRFERDVNSGVLNMETKH
jgi:hypothetical protein